MSRVEHIVFDLDGTLYEQTPVILGVIYDKMLTTLADYLRIKEPGKWSKLSKIGDAYLEYYGQLKSHTEAFKMFKVPDEEAKRLATQAFNEADIERYLGQDNKLLALLDRLDNRNVPYGLYTGRWKETGDDVLKKLGIPSLKRLAWAEFGDKYPKSMGTTEGFKQSLWNANGQLRDRYEKKLKHDRENGIKIRRKPYSFNPKNVWYVGDREDMEIKPALKVGMSVVRVCREFGPPFYDKVASDPADNSDPREEQKSWKPNHLLFQRKEPDHYLIRDIYSLGVLVDHLLDLKDSGPYKLLPKSDKKL